MRIPYTFALRNSIKRTAERLCERAGLLGPSHGFRIVRRIEPNTREEPKFTSDEFANILAAVGVNSSLKAQKEWVYHCFVTRWKHDFVANSIWLFTRRKKYFSYSSFKNEIEAQVDLRFLGESTDYIRVDGEDVLDWLKTSTGGSTYLCLICRRNHAGDTVSLALEFCNSKDAVAYKLVFG